MDKEKDSKLLYYDNIVEFKRVYYKDLLTPEHLSSGQIKIDKISTPDGSQDDTYNFWGWTLEKNGYKYLVSSNREDGREIKLKDILPLMIKNPRKVASKGVVYYHIITPTIAKFKSERNHTFRELVDYLSSLKHSNPLHQKIFWFMSLTSLMERVNWRICTPPGFGKDSGVDILGNLIGNCATIENPTVAKLEYMTSYKWVAINEIIDLTKESFGLLEQFLLAAGGMKPEITKHSRALHNSKEVLDISKLSLSLMYNDIDCYPETDKYFDYVSKRPTRDRFPALRLYGRLQENFNSMNISNTVFVETNFEVYKKFIYSVYYYKDNYTKLVHNYSKSKLNEDIPERWSTNLFRVLTLIDCYCDTQEEFDMYIIEINKCMQDYKDMLNYPTVVKAFIEKLKIPKDRKVDNIKQLRSFLEIDRSMDINLKSSILKFIDTMLASSTFTERNLLLNSFKLEKDNKIQDFFWG